MTANPLNRYSGDKDVKALTTATLLIAGIMLSGCWESEKEQRAREFMSTLSQCDDCKIGKPLIGPGKDADR
jgi:hypothetical protein